MFRTTTSINAKDSCVIRTSEVSGTWDALLFKDDSGSLFYVIDTDAGPGIKQGSGAFRIAGVDGGWADEGSVQGAAEVDAFIEENALDLMGVGSGLCRQGGPQRLT